MSIEPPHKKVVTFFDGQNLYKAAEEAFEVRFPDYDPLLLSTKICQQRDDWSLHEIRFYTGIPPKDRDEFWHGFWARKLAQMGKQGIVVFKRHLRYRRKEIHFGHGGSIGAEIAQEKGIDVRIAIDVIRLALHGVYDVAVIFSQDQDLSEVADEIRSIAAERERWIKICSAFPVSPRRSKNNCRGINKTDWIEIDEQLYKSCVDKRDYRRSR